MKQINYSHFSGKIKKIERTTDNGVFVRLKIHTKKYENEKDKMFIDFRFYNYCMDRILDKKNFNVNDFVDIKSFLDKKDNKLVFIGSHIKRIKEDD